MAANPRARALFGFGEESAQKNLLHHSAITQSGLPSAFARCWRERVSEAGEIEGQFAGQARHLRYILSPAGSGGADGKTPCVQVVMEDITEFKQSEEDRLRWEKRGLLAQKFESLGMLAGGVAHDFNNLLVGIIGNASLALLELPEGSPVRDTIREVERAGEKAAELTKQMLAYSGKGQFMLEPINLSDLVSGMSKLIAASVSKKAALRYDLSESLPLLEADAGQLRQVVLNLVTNASEALGEKNGEVLVRTGVLELSEQDAIETFMNEKLDGGRYVFLEVSDTGYGMDSETQEKIFDPFFSTKFTGRGLGLPAMLGIVRGHRGAVHVTSAPGRGTTIKALFPCME